MPQEANFLRRVSKDVTLIQFLVAALVSTVAIIAHSPVTVGTIGVGAQLRAVTKAGDRAFI